MTDELAVPRVSHLRTELTHDPLSTLLSSLCWPTFFKILSFLLENTEEDIRDTLEKKTRSFLRQNDHLML